LVLINTETSIQQFLAVGYNFEQEQFDDMIITEFQGEGSNLMPHLAILIVFPRRAPWFSGGVTCHCIARLWNEATQARLVQAKHPYIGTETGNQVGRLHKAMFQKHNEVT
jgi:hypothetical protein